MRESRSWASVGVLVVDQFLPRRSVRDLLREMQECPATPADVYRVVSGSRHESAVKSSSLCCLPDATAERQRERLIALLPRLHQFFGMPLVDVSPPEFFRYGPGGHVAPHQDSSERSDVPEVYRRHAVVISIALNTPDDAQMPFEGGELSLYGIVPAGELWSGVPVPIEAVPGRLVAFRADVFHSVSRVRSGTRFSMVSRALGPPLP